MAVRQSLANTVFHSIHIWPRLPCACREDDIPDCSDTDYRRSALSGRQGVSEREKCFPSYENSDGIRPHSMNRVVLGGPPVAVQSFSTISTNGNCSEVRSLLESPSPRGNQRCSRPGYAHMLNVLGISTGQMNIHSAETNFEDELPPGATHGTADSASNLDG